MRVERSLHTVGAVAGLLLTLASTQGAQAQTLEKGRHEWGVSTDYITNLSDRRTNTRFFGISGEYGYFKTAKREYLISGSILQSSTPRSSTSVAGTIMVRQHLRSKGKLIPYVQVGVGALYYGLDTKELNKGFQFHQRLGLGIRYFIDPNSSINLEAGGFHVSNADLRDRNIGVNAGYVAIGYNHLM